MSSRRRRKGVESLLDSLVEMPAWMCPVFAVAAFAIFALLIPAMLPAPDGQAENRTLRALFIPLAQVAGMGLGGFFLLAWPVVAFVQRNHRRRLDAQTGADSLRELSWREFELLIAEAYRRQGFTIEPRGGRTADGGVDLTLHRGTDITLVQCKHWKAYAVDVKKVRELRGIVAAENATRGIVVTSGRFTPDAVEFARSSGIELIDGPALAAMMRSVQGKGPLDNAMRPQVPTATPICPNCRSAMVERVAKRGPRAGGRFWGCSRYPKCSGTLPIDCD